MTRTRRGRASSSSSAISVSLPTARTELPTELSGYVIFIYGQQKIGKTSLTTKAPKTLHFFFEPSGKDYEIFARDINSWEEFVAYIDLLETGEHDFENFAIDIVDLCYEMCYKYICNKGGVEHPPANDFGAMWGDIKKEFRNQMIRLAKCGGVFLISHANVRDMKTRGEPEGYQYITPSISGAGAGVIGKWADLTGVYFIDDEGNRVLGITPTKEYEAGNRMEKRFKYTDGTPMEKIPMGNSPDEAWGNFQKAFKNEFEAPKKSKQKPKKETEETDENSGAEKPKRSFRRKS